MAQHRDSHSFLFADVVGFTALTAARGDEAGVEVALELQSATRSLAADCGAELVKAMGDAVMVHGCDAADMVRLGLRLADELLALPTPLQLRVAVHSGPAVSCADDWYGNTVNVAARLVELAGEGELLVSDGAAQGLPSADAFELIDRGPWRPRGARNPIQVFVARSLQMQELSPVAIAV